MTKSGEDNDQLRAEQDQTASEPSKEREMLLQQQTAKLQIEHYSYVSPRVMGEYNEVYPGSAEWFFNHYGRLREAWISREKIKQYTLGVMALAPVIAFVVSVWLNPDTAIPAACMATLISGLAIWGIVLSKSKDKSLHSSQVMNSPKN